MKTTLEFKLETDGKVYQGTVTVPAGKGACTLPMMINSLMVNLAKEHPEFHKATQCTFKASVL